MKIIKFIFIILVVFNSYVPKAKAMEKEAACFLSVTGLSTFISLLTSASTECDPCNVTRNRVNFGFTVVTLLCLCIYAARLHNRRTNQNQDQLPNNS